MGKLPLIRTIFYSIRITQFFNKIPSQGFVSFVWQEPRYYILWVLLFTDLCSNAWHEYIAAKWVGCDPIICRNKLKSCFIVVLFCLFVHLCLSLFLDPFIDHVISTSLVK